MRYQRVCISLLLLITIAFALKPSFAQSLTTITNVTTLTTQSAQTAYSVLTAGTNYQTTTISPVVLDYTLQVSSAQNGKFCEIKVVNFIAQAQDQISGNITATSNVQLFLIRDSSFQTWNALTSAHCDPEEDVTGADILNLGPAKSINLQWTPVISGTYWFLVENFDVVQSPSVHLLLVSQPTATTQTNYLYATSESTAVATIMQTQTSYQTQQIENLSSGIGAGSWTTILAVIAVIVILGIVAFVVLRVRKGSKPTGPKCAKCGAKIPQDAKFCKKCGAPVE